ncbi:hypothetical protein EJ08DRAFT_703568 [Tothia fuscella]|uniref:Uncharacterized protein n=1 Tax=Tothia fuscella TaxID=1048955 RepID=A0A9P4NE55_9PEZI|nr:hypothetical protein EJ08DRAFT_703568 [Tothia fuscella]
MDEHLRTALISIEEGQKVEILEAVTGHRDTEVHWQEQETDDYEVKVAKISWREQYNVSGLRLEGMSRIGYIWGQDNHCGFEDTGKFCDVFWLDYGATYLERPLVESNEERLVRKLKEMFLDLRCSRMTRVEFRRVVERDLPRLSRVGLDV